MRRVLLALCVLALMAMPAMAEQTDRGLYTTPSPYLSNLLNTNEYVYHTHELPDQARLTVGAKVDAPDLVRFTKNLTLGFEGGKDLYNDPFMDSGYATEDDKGYFAYVKLTYSGTFLNFAD